jgi:hypothetical protein
VDECARERIDTAMLSLRSAFGWGVLGAMMMDFIFVVVPG